MIIHLFHTKINVGEKKAPGAFFLKKGVFKEKTGILIVLRGFWGKIRKELNNEYRITNIE